MTQKHGNRFRDCEDSASVSQRHGRAAIADGASQSWAARGWARTLTRHWVGGAPDTPAAFAEWLGGAQAIFAERDDAAPSALPSYLARNRSARAPVAHATFVGIELVDHQLRLVGLGDSYALVVRDDSLVASVPAHVDAVVFGSEPALIPSCGEPGAALAAGILAVQDGDRCYLASDALAEVLRDRHLAGEPLWSCLDELDGANFVDLVTELRGEGMENDDVALVVARVEPEPDVIRF